MSNVTSFRFHGLHFGVRHCQIYVAFGVYEQIALGIKLVSGQFWRFNKVNRSVLSFISFAISQSFATFTSFTLFTSFSCS